MELPLITALNADPRPALVVDLAAVTSPSHLRPVAVNRSLKEQSAVFRLLFTDDSEGVKLREWINGAQRDKSLGKEQHTHGVPGGNVWFAYTVDDRWRIVQLTATGPVEVPQDVVTPPTEACFDGEAALAGFAPPSRVETVTVVYEHFALTEQAIASVAGLAGLLDVIASFDWASTFLGPISVWPNDLLQLVHLILLDPSPQSLFLGDDHILLYNVAYAELAGERHPSIMGQGIFKAWSEAVELNISTFKFIDTTGRPFIMNDFNISLDRNGFLEDIYFRWTTIPIKGPLRGYLCTAAEETMTKVGLRRKALLTAISNACRGIRDMSAYWHAVLQTIGTNGKDFPFAFVYSKVLDQENQYTLEGILDAEYPAQVLPSTINVSTDAHMMTPALMDAQNKFNPIAISEAEGTLPDAVMALSEKRGSGDRCRSGLICPIRRASDNQTLGLLVVGQNTRKTFGPDDQAFIQYAMRALGDLATNTINAQETDRLAKQTASQHKTLVQALETTTLEANHMTEKFHHVVKTMEMVDVGIFEFDLEGRLVQSNEAFYKLSGIPVETRGAPFSWKDCIHEDDLELATQNWARVAQGEQVNFEFRYKYAPGSKVQDQGEPGMGGQWVSAAVVPFIDSQTGKVTAISGCVTDIMPLKRGQIEAIRRTEVLEKLRESEQRFNRFADNAVCPIYIYGADRKLKFCNDAYYELIGRTRSEDLTGLEWGALILDEDLPAVVETWRKCFEEKSCVLVTCRLKREVDGPDGKRSPVWIMASAYPEWSTDGEITGWVGVAFDISRLKWAEKIQEVRMQEIIEAKRQQENFIDMTSHEIRNPLGAVVHCADAILATLVDLETIVKDKAAIMPEKLRRQLLDIHDSSLDAVNTIISCSVHQRRIVDDVLTWSKLNSDLLKITPSVVRPSAILQDIRGMFELDAQKVGVQLVVNQETSDTGALNIDWLMLDSGRLSQVWINLLTNALKFTKEEAVRKVTVTMGMTASEPSLDRIPVDFVPNTGKDVQQSEADWGIGQPVYLYFIVEDTGCGLTPEEKSKIFARFSQGSPRTHTRYGGSGLGLFISRELVELQCGSIGFASQSGVGSKFGFFIKARAADAEHIPSATATASSTPALRPGRMSSGGMSLKSPRFSILVVEDNVVNQAVLSKQLRKLGHEVHVANHGVEALKFIQGTKMWRGPMDTPNRPDFPSYDHVDDTSESTRREADGMLAPPPWMVDGGQVDLSVILMDVEMPVMDGLTCAAEIRRWQAQGMIDGHLPIIAVSANARSEQVGQALACGMDDAISKPFRIVDLMPKIERLAG